MTRMPMIFSLGAAAAGAPGAAAAGVGTGVGAGETEGAWAAPGRATRSAAARTAHGKRLVCPEHVSRVGRGKTGWELLGKSTSCWELERRGRLLLFPENFAGSVALGS